MSYVVSAVIVTIYISFVVAPRVGALWASLLVVFSSVRKDVLNLGFPQFQIHVLHVLSILCCAQEMFRCHSLKAKQVNIGSYLYMYMY